MLSISRFLILAISSRQQGQARWLMWGGHWSGLASREFGAWGGICDDWWEVEMVSLKQRDCLGVEANGWRGSGKKLVENGLFVPGIVV